MRWQGKQQSAFRPGEDRNEQRTLANNLQVQAAPGFGSGEDHNSRKINVIAHYLVGSTWPSARGRIAPP
jgi:hypothetical protein